MGMNEISWGGFSALQLAALGPKGLRAIITNYADMHYMGDQNAGSWTRDLPHNNLVWVSSDMST
ncbi:hypothetical protein NKJ36_33165 [Mesorhizobium sp. M0142]